MRMMTKRCPPSGKVVTPAPLLCAASLLLQFAKIYWRRKWKEQRRYLITKCWGNCSRVNNDKHKPRDCEKWSADIWCRRLSPKDHRQRTPSGPGQALIAEIKFISFINTWIHQARCQVIKRILCPENAEEVEGSAAWLHLNDSRGLTFAACHAAY